MVELWIAAGTGESTNIGDNTDVVRLEQAKKHFDGPVGVAYGPELHTHTARLWIQVGTLDALSPWGVFGREK